MKYCTSTVKEPTPVHPICLLVIELYNYVAQMTYLFAKAGKL